MVLQAFLIAQHSVALGMRTVNQLTVGVVWQVLAVERPFEAVSVAEAFRAKVEEHFR